MLALTTLPAHCAGDLWTEDFEAAKTSATKGKKDLLMDFTGSDWCGWCIKLREEVFDTAEFKAEAPKNFVMVELDYPQNKEQSDQIKAQNEKLRDKFHIEGYPTIILADAEGRPYAKTGYQEGGPKEYLKHLAELRSVREKRDAALEKAAKAEGLEKAKLLVDALKGIDSELVDNFYDSLMQEVISLDKEDTLGMKKKQEFQKAYAELQTKLEELHDGKKFTEFGKAIDDFITTHKLEGEQKQMALYNKLAIFGPDRLDDAEKLVNELIKLGADTSIGENAKMILEQIKEMRAQVGKSKGAGAEGTPGEEPADKPEKKGEESKKESEEK